jgi:hypothetical protein
VSQGGHDRVYVYAVLSASEQANVSVAGVEEAPVRTIEHAGLAALVSDLEADELSAAREVRAHWRVLEQASEGATVVPVRFGMVLEGDRAVREQLLEPNADRLTELLRELTGRLQLSVSGDYDEERLLHGVVRSSPQVAALRERVRELPESATYYDRIKLGEWVAAEVARHREEDTALVLARLEPFAVSARPEDVSSPAAAFKLAFLVDKDKLDRFSEAVGRLREELGDRIELRYVGPLPPYTFADVDLSTGDAAWA